MLVGLGEGMLYPRVDGGLMRRFDVDGVGLVDETLRPKDCDEVVVEGGLIEFDGRRSDELDPARLIEGVPWPTFWDINCCCLGVLRVVEVDGREVGEGAIDRGV